MRNTKFLLCAAGLALLMSPVLAHPASTTLVATPVPATPEAPAAVQLDVTCVYPSQEEAWFATRDWSPEACSLVIESYWDLTEPVKFPLTLLPEHTSFFVGPLPAPTYVVPTSMGKPRPRVLLAPPHRTQHK